MNLTSAKIRGILLAAALSVWCGTSRSQEAITETRTTTTSGTITRFEPGNETMVIRTETGPEPLNYAITKRTTIVDETGAPVSVERIVSGAPVSVQYIREGDRMLANRIVVRRVAAEAVPVPAPPVRERTTTTTTTTTTAAGTITDFEPGSRTMIVRSESGPEPTRYTVSRETTYVDEAGAPISVEAIHSGVPVTVHYVRDANGMLVSRVVVHRPVAVEEPRREEVRRPLTHDEREAVEKWNKAERKRAEHEEKELRKERRERD